MALVNCCLVCLNVLLVVLWMIYLVLVGIDGLRLFTWFVDCWICFDLFGINFVCFGTLRVVMFTADGGFPDEMGCVADCCLVLWCLFCRWVLFVFDLLTGWVIWCVIVFCDFDFD